MIRAAVACGTILLVARVPNLENIVSGVYTAPMAKTRHELPGSAAVDRTQPPILPTRDLSTNRGRVFKKFWQKISFNFDNLHQHQQL